MTRFLPHSPVLAARPRAWRWLVAALLALVLSPALATPPWLHTDGHEEGRAITDQAEILEDPAGRLDLGDVQAARAGWKPGVGSALGFGFSHATYWVRWLIRNDGVAEADLVLDLGNPRQDHIHWYVLDEAGRLLVDARSGDRLPYGERLLPARRFALPIALPAGRGVQVLVRLASQDGLYEAMPTALYSRASFHAVNEREDLILTLYHGGLLALALYNLLLYIATRERSFGLYVGYLSCLLAWNLIFQGYGFKYLWPQAMAFNNNALTVCAAWAFGIFGFFTVEYLQLHQTAPRWVPRLILGMAWANIAVVIPATMDLYAVGAGMGHITGLGMTVSALAVGVWRLMKHQRQARFFVLAFAALGLGAGAYILQVIGIVPVNAFTTWGLQVGSGFEALVLALGLADAMNTLKAQKLEAERRERLAQQALNTQLELKVDERTRELARANQRLQRLAVTDELTGAYNRRRFNDVCRAAFDDRRHSAGLALCMFDLDHFKRFNDRHGHQAGDQALRLAAAAVQDALRRSEDALFRLGGEEFAVLFSADSPEQAVAVAEEMRAAIIALQLPHPDSAAGILTASFGVAYLHAVGDTEVSADRLYALADQALYAAKAQGRNCVVAVSAAPARPGA